MDIDFSLLQDEWSPGDSILLLDCSIRGECLHYGLGWFRARQEKDSIIVRDINGFEVTVFLDKLLINQEDPIIRVNSQLEFRFS